MTAGKKQRSTTEAGATELSEDQLEDVQGGEDLLTWQKSTVRSKTIIGGFKSVSGMDSETEVIE